MADALLRLYGPAQPGTSNDTLYTAATAGGAVIRNIHVANGTALWAAFSLSINGTSATAANCFYVNFMVPPYGIHDASVSIPLANGDTLQGHQETASALTITVSGVTS
jgi:hypothetical protein